MNYRYRHWRELFGTRRVINKINIDSEVTKQIVRFSPVAWQYINLIGKYEFCNFKNSIDIQQLKTIMMTVIEGLALQDNPAESTT